MKKHLLFLAICFSTVQYAQDLASKVPDNAPFALCFNGKNLNEKVAIKTIQEYPWMQELLEKQLKFLPKDLTQTGIDLINKQYQYYINKDSVMSYVVLIPLNNVVLFEKMIQNKYGDSLTIKKEGICNSISTSKTHHLAWNDKFAVMINASYTKPYKDIYNDNDPYSNLTSIDTTGILDNPKAEPALDAYNTYEYEEIKPIPEEKNKKDTKGKKSKKTIEEPVKAEPTEDEIYEAQEKAYAELDATNQKLLELELKKTDSIEKLKIDPVVALIFKETFETKTNGKVANSVIFKNNNPKSDFYFFADFDELTTQLYSGLLGANSALTSIYKNGILNSNFYLNGYFEVDRIKLNQVITPKNEVTKKSYQEIFDSKIDKNMLNYVGNKILGYYSIAMDTEAIMNYEYKVLKNTLNSVYQSYSKDANGKEIDVLIDAVALVLDEKAIADLIPGNALFVLHDLKKVQREYVKIDYDENYEQIETNETKDEIQPEFTFLMNTRNESFVNRLLQLPLNKAKITSLDYQMTDGYYTIHFENDNLLENLYLGLKNGVFMLTSSKINIENLIHQTVMPLQDNFRKSISKNNAAAWFDIQKIINASKTEIEKDNNNNYFDIMSKNAGEISFESKFKNGTIVSDAFYTIKGEHINSLQYFFDIINELDAEKSKNEEIITE